METTKTVFEQLTPEQREQLRSEILKEEKDKEARIKEERRNYKKLVNETIPGLFKQLVATSQSLSSIKKKVFEELDTLVKLKAELYDSELEQGSHSFTTEDGITLQIGHRYTDGWDDTVDVGIAKVNAYVTGLGKDANSKKLVKAVMQLLSKDKSGNLKASRVLQLHKIAEESGDAEFIDSLNIIKEAYRPNKSKEFVTVRYKDNNGDWQDLPLDISAAEFDFIMHRNEPTTAKA